MRFHISTQTLTLLEDPIIIELWELDSPQMVLPPVKTLTDIIRSWDKASHSCRTLHFLAYDPMHSVRGAPDPEVVLLPGVVGHAQRVHVARLVVGVLHAVREADEQRGLQPVRAVACLRVNIPS